jgi:hypothetical protein
VFVFNHLFTTGFRGDELQSFASERIKFVPPACRFHFRYRCGCGDEYLRDGNRFLQVSGDGGREACSGHRGFANDQNETFSTRREGNNARRDTDSGQNEPANARRASDNARRDGDSGRRE